MTVVKGDKIQLNNAIVLSARQEIDPRWGSFVKVMTKDEQLGKVWFKTSAGFSFDLSSNQLISCELTVSGTGEDIIFAKAPKKAIVRDSF